MATTRATTNRVLPGWADELRKRYLRNEASFFVLHGNVYDTLLFDGQLMQVPEFLATVLFDGSKNVIVRYNVSTGARFVKKSSQIEGLEQLLLERTPDKVLPVLERALFTQDKMAVLMEYAEMLGPMGDAGMMMDFDRASVVSLHRWSLAPQIAQADNIVVLITETLSELNSKIVSNPRVATVKVPMPDAAERGALIRHLDKDIEPSWADRLTEITAGLKTIQIQGIVQQPPAIEGEADQRLRFIKGLLGGGAAAEERARKLTAMTAGMTEAEIKDLIAPGGAPVPPAGAGGPSKEDEERKQILTLIAKRKREIIERECFGLIEFVEPEHDFSVVGGIDEVKKELSAVAKNIREGRRNRVPMGMLFTGPMGTGKTFVAEAFVKESGLTAIKLKNFRSKWVGATESNLEKILGVIQGIGQVIVIIDEGDRAFGNGEGGEGDGGTGSRVIGRIKEFMSDTTNRGRVLFILMTNRPDRLDIDIKRAGRLDRKIPFLYPQTSEEVEQILMAQVRKHKLQEALEFPRDRATISDRIVGYSNADFEALVLLGNEYASDRGPESPITVDDFVRAVGDYLPSRDTEMLEFMELLAVFEASNRRMLPKKYATLTVDQLTEKLAFYKSKIGTRR
ncbi:MAG: ATP-binding protein [Deltaproteobacteria bacterium]|nr:ATP-binding protein [Deltaproteobacteria bacterium]